jgi:hypothetical protein
MLLPPHLDGAQVRLALSNCQTHISVTGGDIGDLVQNVISVGSSFSHHAYIIHLLAESATVFLLLKNNMLQENNTIF